MIQNTQQGRHQREKCKVLDQLCQSQDLNPVLNEINPTEDETEERNSLKLTTEGGCSKSLSSCKQGICNKILSFITFN